MTLGSVTYVSGDWTSLCVGQLDALGTGVPKSSAGGADRSVGVRNGAKWPPVWNESTDRCFMNHACWGCPEERKQPILPFPSRRKLFQNLPVSMETQDSAKLPSALLSPGSSSRELNSPLSQSLGSANFLPLGEYGFVSFICMFLESWINSNSNLAAVPIVCGWWRTVKPQFTLTQVTRKFNY